MSERLFADFSPVDAQTWKEKIVRDLKGKPYENLTHSILGNITVKPDFTRSDSGHNTGVPGRSPHARGSKIESNVWEVAQRFGGNDPKKVNETILHALMHGSNYIWLEASASSLATEHVLKDVHWPSVSIQWNTPSTSLVQEVRSWIQYTDWPADQLTGCFGYDPIGSALERGAFADDEAATTAEWCTLLAKHRNDFPRCRYFQVSAAKLAEAGATPITEVGSALAWAHEYLVEALEAGIPVDEFTARMQFTLGLGTDYFTELAKFRALRVLWSRIVRAYQPEHECSSITWVMGVSNTRYLSATDAYTNMLRSTTMAMSGALGGCDGLCMAPYDVHLEESDPRFAARIARNVSLILQEESHLDKVLDPAAGSYFIESLTNQLCDEAWKSFQDIEAQGGFRKAMRTNYIQDRIETEASRDEAKVKSGEQVLVGVNRYTQEQADFTLPEKEQAPEGTTFRPVTPVRLSSSFEQQPA